MPGFTFHIYGSSLWMSFCDQIHTKLSAFSSASMRRVCFLIKLKPLLFFLQLSIWAGLDFIGKNILWTIFFWERVFDQDRSLSQTFGLHNRLERSFSALVEDWILVCGHFILCAITDRLKANPGLIVENWNHWTMQWSVRLCVSRNLRGPARTASSSLRP